MAFTNWKITTDSLLYKLTSRIYINNRPETLGEIYNDSLALFIRLTDENKELRAEVTRLSNEIDSLKVRRRG